MINAAAEAAERGETVADFLDHAALVADADAFDEQRAGDADDPAQRQGAGVSGGVPLRAWKWACSRTAAPSNSEAALEEERRLCYVGMTRARKRLVLTWAKYRRRFGGGEQERSTPSWFLSEVPAELIVDLGPRDDPGEVDLIAERHDVRQTARRNTFTGKTYNSHGEHFAVFRRAGNAVQRSAPAAARRRGCPIRRSPPSRCPQPPPAPRRGARTGMTVEHPKYGMGTVVRREGEGEDAKITVNFPRFGLKKLIEKYAGLKRN